MSNVEVNVVSDLMGDEGSEFTSDNTMPVGLVGLFERVFDKLCNFLFVEQKTKGSSSLLSGKLFHMGVHVTLFDFSATGRLQSLLSSAMID